MDGAGIEACDGRIFIWNEYNSNNLRSANDENTT